jgi:hypothetical protein
MLRTALNVRDCGGILVVWSEGGALTGQGGFVLEVGVLILLMALDGLLKAVEALHEGRKAVVTSG